MTDVRMDIVDRIRDPKFANPRYLEWPGPEAAAEIERLRIELAGCKLALTHPHGEIGVGDRVKKITGYLWPGVVRSVFTTIKGEVRYVVECTVPEVAGALHIYSGSQIERAE